MHISKVKVENFRLLRDSTLDLRENLSLLVGRNNTGKTSLLVLFEKFFDPSKHFHYNDFPLVLRDKIHKLNEKTEIDDLSIRMVLEIQYNEKDNLENLSEFILDLDPNINVIKILFECRINKETLLKELTGLKGKEREKKIITWLDSHLKNRIYAYDDSQHDGKDDFFKVNRHKFIENKKELKHVHRLINLHIVHARRNISSSEEMDKKKPLSAITTAYFNREHEHEHEAPNKDLVKIHKTLINMDNSLDENYDSFFENFLKNSKKFLDLETLKVKSNIESKMLFENSSQVIYGSKDNHLPEQLNGLGYMNILYLLLQIEVKKKDFEKQKKDINLLFIEEPEAHTHPQMQYIFAKEIKEVLGGIERLQALITTHSSHIVSLSDFEDIRYLKLINDENIEIKNFHTELKKEYTKEEEFKFLEQYLNIQSAELFFATKVIFIEGITERMLLPYFIQKFDNEGKKNAKYIPIASQNISILEVGANAKVFAPFLKFLDIKTLIITDIDTTKKETTEKETKTITTYPAVQVTESTHTSNETIKYFFNAPCVADNEKFPKWFTHLRNHSLKDKIENIKVMYQKVENGYHARSFEDAFININKESIKSNKDEIAGLKNRNELDNDENIYSLTEKILDKKSSFAASLLYLALSKDDEIQWKTPLYIKDGLSWIQEE